MVKWWWHRWRLGDCTAKEKLSVPEVHKVPEDAFQVVFVWVVVQIALNRGTIEHTTSSTADRPNVGAISVGMSDVLRVDDTHLVKARFRI